MHNKCSVHIQNSLDSPLSSSILILRSNTPKTMRLILLIKIFLENIYSKNSIIAMEMLDLSCCLIPKSLIKIYLTYNGFTRSKIYLNFNQKNTRPCVIIYSTYMKMTIGPLSAISTWQLIGVFNLKLIDR